MTGFDWRWSVASTGSIWSDAGGKLINWCLTCEAFGLTCAWDATSEAATGRWVTEHSNWHATTPPPGPVVRPLPERLQSWD